MLRDWRDAKQKCHHRTLHYEEREIGVQPFMHAVEWWCHLFAKNTFLRRLELGEVNKLRFW